MTRVKGGGGLYGSGGRGVVGEGWGDCMGRRTGFGEERGGGGRDDGVSEGVHGGPAIHTDIQRSFFGFAGGCGELP